ncbi:hypothetical protein GGS24DRAFT_491490 [Hypoxylon argillaceum]|nr:hypothetical protein GGS24DRAFT_491490 [Hypoxylon argillaceum]
MARTRNQTRRLSRAAESQGNKSRESEEQSVTKRTKRNCPRPSVTASRASSRQGPSSPVQNRSRKRKQSIENELQLEPNPTPDQKRQRTSCTHTADDTCSGPAACGNSPKQVDPVAFWAREGHWPKEQYWADRVLEMDIFKEHEHLFARRRALLKLPRKREQRSALYRNARYPLLLEINGSYMAISKFGITDTSKDFIQTLLGGEITVPKETLFDDDIFVNTCNNLENKNEARVIQDISRLLVPSAESLAHRAETLICLAESVNEGWDNSVPLTGTRPQPDYAVGFKREAFTAAQLTKLSPLIGDLIAGDCSLFMATYYMYFPFLTCEVKCGTGALDVADRQNAHSMTLAVRAITELYRAVKRENEVHRKILGFSISHDHKSVRIFGHYPVIDRKSIKYYRHPIRQFDFTELNGKEKWTTYRFTKSVYDLWMPVHYQMICSAIDQLPSNLGFDRPSLSTTGLSGALRSQDLSQPNASAASLSAGQHGESSITGQRKAAPGTSYMHPGEAKRRKSGN